MKTHKYKKMSFPRNVVGNLPLSESLLKKEKQPCLIKQAEDPRQKPSGMTNLFYNGNHGFTLIELLVVVLIIGILAAVALPQYQKAVEKSRAVQAITLLKSVYNAAKAYQLASGEWPTSVDELAVETPWTGTTNGINLGHHKQGQSNADWSIQIRQSGSTSVSRGIIISRLSGPYKGSAFAIYADSDDGRIPIDQLLCVEMVSQNNYPFTKSKGAYCQKIMKGTLLHTNGEGAWNYFRMP